MARLPAAAAFCVCILVLGICGVAQADTKVITMVATSIAIKTTAQGSCWEGSLAASRPDAYRCTVGNTIKDPCLFLAPVAVICTDGEEILLTKALPQTPIAVHSVLSEKDIRAFSGMTGWRYQLEDGQQCGPMTGTTVGGLPIGCSGGLYCENPTTGGPGSRDRFLICMPMVKDPSGFPTVDASQSHPYRISTMWQ